MVIPYFEKHAEDMKKHYSNRGYPEKIIQDSYCKAKARDHHSLIHGEKRKKKQERLKGRNTLSCLDQYAAQNSKYARPPIPSQLPTQKVFFQWHTQYDPTMKHSHCETVYAKELFPMAVL